MSDDERERESVCFMPILFSERIRQEKGMRFLKTNSMNIQWITNERKCDPQSHFGYMLIMTNVNMSETIWLWVTLQTYASHDNEKKKRKKQESDESMDQSLKNRANLIDQIYF